MNDIWTAIIFIIGGATVVTLGEWIICGRSIEKHIEMFGGGKEAAERYLKNKERLMKELKNKK